MHTRHSGISAQHVIISMFFFTRLSVNHQHLMITYCCMRGQE